MTSEQSSIFLEEIAEFLNCFFVIERFPITERGGVYLASSYPIRRLGLALEPCTDLQEWVNSYHLDAVFLHRPWKLEANQISPGLGVISYHLPFDECLTLGFNLRLAQVLRMSGLEVLGEKENRPIGMLGEIPSVSFTCLCSCVTQVFGKHEQVSAAVNTNEDVTRIAVVGAMTDSLVREAAARNANVYITGQFRQASQSAVQDTEIGVIAVGHHSCEIWGLRSLAGILQEHWSNLEVFIKI
ncbi:NGG1p interacting factor NIF3 [Hapalosiphon sp. MRB220]|nr:NGG1p interacting factor NIF3 [Hapalosiphon sp. MRB220]